MRIKCIRCQVLFEGDTGDSYCKKCWITVDAYRYFGKGDSE